MINWYPNSVKFHSLAESLVFSQLNQLLHDPWIGCHSHELFIQSKRIERGEADFILFHPEKGIFVLEVKGGLISYCSQTGWQGKNKQGQAYKLDPVHQATSNLKMLLSQMQAYLKIDVEKAIPHACATIFPQCHIGNDLPPGCGTGSSKSDVTGVWDDRHLEQLNNHIEKSLACFGSRKKMKSNVMTTREVERYFKGTTLQVAVSEKFDLLNGEQKIDTTTQRQMQTFSFMKDKKNFNVRGVSGSGKTWCARALGLYHHGQGRRVLLLCFNRALAWSLQKNTLQSSSDPFESDKITISTYHQLCKHLALKANIDMDSLIEEDPYEFWNKSCAEMALDALDKVDLSYDVVLVDEGQDMQQDWWVSIEALKKDDGVQGVFYDPRQNIFQTSLNIPDGEIELTFTVNCRNAGKIFETLKPFYKGDEIYCGCEGLKGEVSRQRLNTQKAIKFLNDEIIRLLNGGLECRNFVLLTRHRLENSILEDIGQLADLPLVDDISKWGKGLYCATYTSFKGLEADIVFMLEVIPFCKKFDEATYANGVGRARQKLYIVDQIS